MPNTSAAVWFCTSFAVLERGNQGFVAGEVRHNAQLDLGIVGGNDDAALRCGKGAAHAAPCFGADGDVLQVGVVAGEAVGNGDGLGVGGMHAAVLGEIISGSLSV